ncbi:mannose-6-phosphate isomerase class I [Pseudarthrobacter sp. W1I19]|uniref:class I mannose-6-phosphate isomerase n=1 Tax=Pseudarthrobacter sp. W1I19 TaxID=3042288 RepID=UPI00277F5A3C|nr:class I mannose-6-phosphate isomerase [Pseudarthrobacter sp. W1I19]MDQ0924707.1 mannose-6-phosphate isomerase class I [Pseudarthrobacter sp. W1I19]
MSHNPPRSYDKFPTVTVPGNHRTWSGQDAWREIARSGKGPVVVDTYPGVDLDDLVAALARALPEHRILNVEELAAHPISHIDALIAPNLTDDRVFGVMSHHTLSDFYDAERLADLGRQASASAGPVILVGWGAALVPLQERTLVLADMARWELQQRQRAGAPNWRCNNAAEDNLRKYKRSFFVEWRVADRHKRQLFPAVDYVLDTNRGTGQAKLITGDAFHEGMAAAAAAPFRVVPFFDPGVWGGQWMKQVIGLDSDAENYAWCFDCVPEENSILLDVGGEAVELPSVDVVFTQPTALLGPRTYARFGAEFPIRFDFLDTMEGGNLSLQVHPLTDYIQDRFGMHYTQDESYYLLDAGPDAVVYLGLQSGTDPEEMVKALKKASDGGTHFPAEDYVNAFPAKKHDHFSIPAGTVHCSGANSMVLEISATPYIFTFKMWDWDRVGLDGRPRPIHVDHASRNIQWDRDTEWAREQLLDQVQELGSGPGWTEERTGLHELEFIEVRRHWFTGSVDHHTNGTVNVLNLVEGSEAVVESPTGSFAPFVVSYAETFIIPASVGAYTIRPHGSGVGQKLATVKAYVRGTEARRAQ